MDKKRLATILFDSGMKITEKEYGIIQESIENDKFTLNEFVTKYKEKDLFFSKSFYLLEDGTRILISTETIKNLNLLNINKDKLTGFMCESVENFKKSLKVLIHGDS